MFLLAQAMVLLVCCARQDIDFFTIPGIPEYSPELQILAAEEFQKLPPACSPHENPTSCSALKLFVIDYGHIRKQIRAVNGRDSG